MLVHFFVVVVAFVRYSLLFIRYFLFLFFLFTLHRFHRRCCFRRCCRCRCRRRRCFCFAAERLQHTPHTLPVICVWACVCCHCWKLSENWELALCMVRVFNVWALFSADSTTLLSVYMYSESKYTKHSHPVSLARPLFTPSPSFSDSLSGCERRREAKRIKNKKIIQRKKKKKNTSNRETISKTSNWKTMKKMRYVSRPHILKAYNFNLSL